VVNQLLLSAKSTSRVPVEVATVYANNDPVGWREAAVELEFPLDILVLAVGHHSLPQCTTTRPVPELCARKHGERHEEGGAR
jgi:hypothetical protein